MLSSPIRLVVTLFCALLAALPAVDAAALQAAKRQLVPPQSYRGTLKRYEFTKSPTTCGNYLDGYGGLSVHYLVSVEEKIFKEVLGGECGRNLSIVFDNGKVASARALDTCTQCDLLGSQALYELGGLPDLGYYNVSYYRTP